MEVLGERLSDERAQQAIVLEASETNASPEMLRDAGIQIHQRLAVGVAV
jgi:hypothetical protein